MKIKKIRILFFAILAFQCTTSIDAHNLLIKINENTASLKKAHEELEDALKKNGATVETHLQDDSDNTTIPHKYDTSTFSPTPIPAPVVTPPAQSGQASTTTSAEPDIKSSQLNARDKAISDEWTKNKAAEKVAIDIKASQLNARNKAISDKWTHDTAIIDAANKASATLSTAQLNARDKAISDEWTKNKAAEKVAIDIKASQVNARNKAISDKWTHDTAIIDAANKASATLSTAQLNARKKAISDEWAKNKAIIDAADKAAFDIKSAQLNARNKAISERWNNIKIATN